MCTFCSHHPEGQQQAASTGIFWLPFTWPSFGRWDGYVDIKPVEPLDDDGAELDGLIQSKAQRVLSPIEVMRFC